jgi:ubiquinone/menaquinone biosynthesis C-methylase UbiE
VKRVAVLGAGAAAGVSLDGTEEVVVLDPSPQALLELRERVRQPGWSFQLGALPVLPLPDASVDVVVGAAADDPEVVRVCR